MHREGRGNFSNNNHPLVKNLACNAEEMSLIPELGRSPGEGNGRIPRTEEPGRLQSMGLKKSRIRLSD